MTMTMPLFAGGLLKHAPALTAISCPTVNDYRRLHMEWAPDLINWGQDDRMVSFRYKNISKTVCDGMGWVGVVWIQGLLGLNWIGFGWIELAS